MSSLLEKLGKKTEKKPEGKKSLPPWLMKKKVVEKEPEEKEEGEEKEEKEEDESEKKGSSLLEKLSKKTK